MLTDRQLAETAFRILHHYLTNTDEWDDKLIGDWLDIDWPHAEEPSSSAEVVYEVGVARQHLERLSSALADRLTVLADDEGFSLKGNA